MCVCVCVCVCMYICISIKGNLAFSNLKTVRVALKDVIIFSTCSFEMVIMFVGNELENISFFL